MRTLIVLSLLVATPVSAQMSDATVSHIETILVDYEVIRDALANDRGAPIAAAARRIRVRAGEASGEATGSTRSQLRALASKARALASVDATDMRELRRAFGRISQPLVTLVRSTPRLRRGRHLFDCPMADGYGEWIQNGEQIENPYMGQRMLTCGAGREW